MYWYLSDGTNTIDLGNYCEEISLGNSKRNFDVNEYIGSNGGFLNGWGNYSQKEFVITIPLKASATDGTYHNLLRTTLNQWFSKQKYIPLYLYIQTGDATSPITKYTRIYCTEFGAEKFKYQRGVVSKSYKLISPSGYFQNSSGSTQTITLTDSSVVTATITNAGDIDCPFTATFTPTGNETYFKIELYDGYGFKLGATYFYAGIAVAYNTADNSLTIGGQAVNVTNYLQSGSVFNLAPGSNTLYCKASGAGSIVITYNTRYI